MSRQALVPSEFLAMVQLHYADALKRVRGRSPRFRCFDCKRWIPRDELPLRCSECSGPDLRVGRFKNSRVKRKLVTQDAMVCKNCVDKHDHLKEMILNLQMEAYAHGLEKQATMRAMGQYARGEAIQ